MYVGGPHGFCDICLRFREIYLLQCTTRCFNPSLCWEDPGIALEYVELPERLEPRSSSATCRCFLLELHPGRISNMSTYPTTKLRSYDELREVPRTAS
jgi:hypothetical protein